MDPNLNDGQCNRGKTSMLDQAAWIQSSAKKNVIKKRLPTFVEDSIIVKGLLMTKEHLNGLSFALFLECT